MDNKISFTSIISWLKSTEMFARPSKQIPGKWQLVEYYIETVDELRNIKELDLRIKKEFSIIELTSEKRFYHQCNLPVGLISKISNGDWFVAKNYIVFSSSDNQSSRVEFQFAIENGKLKLLKKDTLGRIEFFGFFNRIS